MAPSRRKSRGRPKTKKRGNRNKNRETDPNSYYLSGISDGAMKRLARRGGIKRISAGVFEELRKIYGIFIEKLATDSFNYAEWAQRKTIIPLDVIYALKRQGRNIYGYVHDHEVGGHNAIKHDGEEEDSSSD